jgi:hypothetical protein
VLDDLRRLSDPHSVTLGFRRGALAFLNRWASAGSAANDHVSPKRKLRRLVAGLRLKVRKRYANEPNAFGRRESRSDKIENELM